MDLPTLKRANEAGVNQRLAQSLYGAASGTVGWGLPVTPCGKVGDLYLDCCLTVLLCLCVVVSLQRVGERGVHREGGARDTIPFRCPGAEVGHLTSFRAEGAPGVAFPGAELVTEGTGHVRHCTTLNPRIGQRSTRVDLLRGGDLQQSVQAALIDFREAEEFDSELPTFTPTDRGGFDCNGRTQIGPPDEDPHR